MSEKAYNVERLAKLKKNILKDLIVISLEELEQSEKNRIASFSPTEWVSYINFQDLPKTYEVEGDQLKISYQLGGRQYIFIKATAASDTFKEGEYSMIQIVPSIHMPLIYMVIGPSAQGQMPNIPTSEEEANKFLDDVDFSFSYLFE